MSGASGSSSISIVACSSRFISARPPVCELKQSEFLWVVNCYSNVSSIHNVKMNLVMVSCTLYQLSPKMSGFIEI